MDEQQALVCDQALASALMAGYDLGIANHEESIKAHISALPVPAGVHVGFQAKDKIDLACAWVDRAVVALGVRKPEHDEARKPRL